jgi:hypothetical protein
VNNEKSEIVFFCELMKIVSTNVASCASARGVSAFWLGTGCQIKIRNGEETVRRFGVYLHASSVAKVSNSKRTKNLPETARMSRGLG